MLTKVKSLSDVFDKVSGLLKSYLINKNRLLVSKALCTRQEI